jgi:hypothetical protein
MEWLIYFITRLDALGILLGRIIALLLLAGGAVFIICGVSRDNYKVAQHRGRTPEKYDYIFLKLEKYFKPLIIALLIISTLQVLVPTTKEAIAIWTVPQAIESGSAQKIPDLIEKALGIADKKLEELLNAHP